LHTSKKIARDETETPGEQEPMSTPIVLRSALGKHAHVKPLREGTVTSNRVRLEFVEFDPLPKAFRQMVRRLDLDVCEMALTTHVLAHHFGKPITGLPIPLWRRLHHGNLVCAAESTLRGPADLQGRKVGVRAYSQTTGVWIRGLLQSEYGVDLDSITWVTMEDAHVSEYRDPPNVVRNTTATGLRELLLSGEVAAIMGERNVDPANVRPVIPNADEAAVEWSRKTGIFPVNHIVSARTERLRQHSWLAEELMNLFEQAKRKAAGGSEDASLPYGLEPNRRSMQMLLDFAAQQKVTPRAYRVDELFSST
jgi:4,5-dihydroxyphthalate decarboxylase